MQKLLPMHQATRCQAKSKRTGKPCQAPAVKGWAVCRMHGAGGGAPKGSRNALKHGHYTAEAIALRRHLSDLIRQSRAVIAQVEEGQRSVDPR